MWLPPVIGYILALLLSLWGIQFHINIFKYPIYVLISFSLAVFIPLSIIFLLPIDYVSHNSSKSIEWFSLPDTAILYIWKTNYWITFLLTWLILPVLQEFYRSGSYNDLDKLKDALKRNLKLQAIILGVSIIGVFYLIFESGLTFNHIKLMIIAISHIYALVLALWLMSHGLINIPRNKWIEGNHFNNLSHHYLKVPKAIDNLEDTTISFKEEVLQVLVLSKNFTSTSDEDFQYRDWILNLYNSIPAELIESMESQYLESSNNSITRDQLNRQFMTKLTATFNLNLNKVIAYESEFNNLFMKIIQLEDIVNSKSNTTLNESRKLNYRINNHKALLSPRSNYIYQIYFKPIISRSFSLLLFSGSVIILQSELFHSTRLSLINTLVYSTGIHSYNVLQLIISSIIFSYMLFSSLNSLTHLKIFNIYHLVPHNSDIVSCCFYTTYIARLTIPLSYNFITLFISRESIFEQWFGKSIHLTGLFNSLNNWIPRFVMIPVILTIFNVYDKLKKKIGLNSDLYDSWALFDDDNTDQSGNNNDVEMLQNKRKDLIIVEAKRIINREFFKRQQSQNSGEDSLRPFNLSNAANINYENNRRNFNDSLMVSSDNHNANRIDEYHDDLDEDYNLNTQLDYLNNPLTGTSTKTLWGKIGGAFSGIKTSFGRSSDNNQASSTEYRDEPIDSFDYDDDPEEHSVL